MVIVRTDNCCLNIFECILDGKVQLDVLLIGEVLERCNDVHLSVMVPFEHHVAVFNNNIYYIYHSLLTVSDILIT